MFSFSPWPISLLQARFVLLLAWLAYSKVLVAVTPPPPQLDASNYLLQDFHTEMVLAAHEIDQQIEPASLTKLMTAYVVFSELKAGKIKLEDQVRVSEKAWRMSGSKMFIEPDHQVTVEQLLQGMIIQSGNDASVALAEYTAGSEESFVALMNQFAQRLGMTHTHYENSTGMPGQQHYSTARDLGIITMRLIRDFPDYYRWYSQLEYTFNGITQQNRNLLLRWDASVDGVKTGYTKEAGYCLVSSSKQNDMRLISIVLGTADKKARATESQKLLTYGFRFFETKAVYRKEQALITERVWQGESSRLPLGLAQDLYITYPRGEYDKLKPKLEVPSTIIAPVQQGAHMGNIQIFLDGEKIATRPVIALQEIPKGGIFKSLIDYLWMQFQ